MHKDSIFLLIVIVFVVVVIYKRMRIEKFILIKSNEKYTSTQSIAQAEIFDDQIGFGTQGDVYLGTQGRVKKVYKKRLPYLKNVLALKIFAGNRHFPKLYDTDDEELAVYMSHCGDSITSKNIPNDFLNQIDEINKAFENENVSCTDTFSGNFTAKDGIIYIVDLGTINFGYSPIDGNVLLKRYQAK